MKTKVNRRPISMRWNVGGLALLCTTLLAGCGAPTKTLNVDSKPQGAVVYLDGQEKGTTPLTLQLVYQDPHQIHIVQVRKPSFDPGYQTYLITEVPSSTKMFHLIEETF
jgi:hypothetical protein